MQHTPEIDRVKVIKGIYREFAKTQAVLEKIRGNVSKAKDGTKEKRVYGWGGGNGNIQDDEQKKSQERSRVISWRTPETAGPKSISTARSI